MLMNIRHIDLRLLRSFIAVARAENFVRASESLSITQSALSQQMKELGSHFPSPLFEKKGRKLILSRLGSGLLERMEPLLGQVEEGLLKSIHENNNIVGTLRVGATNTYSQTIALPASMRLIENNPNLKITLRDLPAQKVLSDLMQNEIDIAIIPQDYQFPDLQWQKLISEQFSIIGTPQLINQLPTKLNIQSLANLELATLTRQFLMRQKIEMQARKEGAYLNIRMEVSTMGDLLEIAKSGSLLAIGSPISILHDKKLKSKEIKGEFLTRTAALCWREGKFITSAMSAFQEAASSISADLNLESRRQKKGPA